MTFRSAEWTGALHDQLLAACKQALAALQSESKLERANAIKALRAAIERAEQH